MKSSLFVCLFSFFGPAAQAATLTNNVNIYPYLRSPAPPNSFAIDYHGFPEAVFTPTSDSSYLFSFMGIAEGFAFYNINHDDLMDSGNIQRNARLISNNNNPGSATFDLARGESRYLGYWVGWDLETDWYGWVRVSRTPAGLVASESATSMGNGIHVGSFTEVPEPSVSLLSLSIIIPLLRRRRTSAIASAAP